MTHDQTAIACLFFIFNSVKRNNVIAHIPNPASLHALSRGRNRWVLQTSRRDNVILWQTMELRIIPVCSNERAHVIIAKVNFRWISGPPCVYRTRGCGVYGFRLPPRADCGRIVLN